MKLQSRQSTRLTCLLAICLYFLAAVHAFGASASNRTTKEHKTTIKGVVIGRDGDEVRIEDAKDGSIQTVAIGDETKIERDKGLSGFYGRSKAGLTALVPGVTIRAEGVKNVDEKIEAKTVRFNPDVFAIAVAEEQQIRDNQAATQRAVESANEGITRASTAQWSADQAQSTANQGVSTAQAAGMLAAADAIGVSLLNERVSDLSEYETVAQVGVYFPENSEKLDALSKASLDELVSANSNLPGYVVEIAGYASSTGNARYNQKLSETRARL